MFGWYPPISEENRLQNLIQSCDAQLDQDAGNLYWQNVREGAQERLEEIYSAEYADELAEDMSEVETREDALDISIQ